MAGPIHRNSDRHCFFSDQLRGKTQDAVIAQDYCAVLKHPDVELLQAQSL
jgi:hypothetical protein